MFQTWRTIYEKSINCPFVVDALAKRRWKSWGDNWPDFVTRTPSWFSTTSWTRFSSLRTWSNRWWSRWSLSPIWATTCWRVSWCFKIILYIFCWFWCFLNCNLNVNVKHHQFIVLNNNEENSVEVHMYYFITQEYCRYTVAILYVCKCFHLREK